MSEERPRRKPQLIDLDDPDLVVAAEGGVSWSVPATSAADDGARNDASPATPGRAAARGWRWGATLLAALGLLASLALSLSFARFVSVVLDRQDWIGWLALGLLGIAGLSLLVIVVREVVGILRLRRLGRARRALEAALLRRDLDGERRAIEEIFGRLGARPELKWPLATLAEHARSVHDPGDLARLADRDVMPALDGEARRLVAASARRVSVVTALSPTALLTVGWILAENLRLLRGLATLYGGQPGFLGTTRLARMVVTHIVAAGGIALTDDLLGQFLGQDLVRRLSRRLGESVFNAALTARIGAAAIEVIRPLPFIEAPRVRARDFVAEIVRWQRTGKSEDARDVGAPGGSGPSPSSNDRRA